jgi:alpha-beta hydrolase superfamily lysophospholipase/thiol-disulfide isomerase/thioredoxin
MKTNDWKRLISFSLGLQFVFTVSQPAFAWSMHQGEVADVSGASSENSPTQTDTASQTDTAPQSNTAPTKQEKKEEKKKEKEAKKEEKKEEKDKSKDDAAAAPATESSLPPCISWVSPLAKPRLILLCIHGLGLYSGSYKDFGTHLSQLGIGTYAIDVRGFGSWMKSGGKQEVDFNGCLEDIRTSIVSLKAANPNLPFFLLGESMGGAIALRFASMHPEMIDGLISSVPSGERFQQKKTDLKVALEFLMGPNKDNDVGVGVVKQATKNPKLRKDWENDPLDRMDLSAKDLIHFQRFMNENHDAAKEVKTLPVLFVQGMEDRLVKPEGTWDLFNQLATQNKYFVALPSEHLIFEETQDNPLEQKLKNFRLLTAWLMTEAHVNFRYADQMDQSALSNGISLMLTGNYDGAKTALMQLVTLEPRNTLAHYFLGQTYLKTKQPGLARQEFVKSVDLARGSQLASQANGYLLNMSKTPGTSADNSKQAPIPPAPEITQGKVTLLAFYANWAAQCDLLDSWFEKGKARFGDKVQFKKLDVDDDANKPLVKQFLIGPIPTIVLLTADGKVSSTIIGQTTIANILDGLAPLIKRTPPPSAVKK